MDLIGSKSTFTSPSLHLPRSTASYALRCDNVTPCSRACFHILHQPPFISFACVSWRLKGVVYVEYQSATAATLLQSRLSSQSQSGPSQTPCPQHQYFRRTTPHHPISHHLENEKNLSRFAPAPARALLAQTPLTHTPAKILPQTPHPPFYSTYIYPKNRAFSHQTIALERVAAGNLASSRLYIPALPSGFGSNPDLSGH